MSHSNSSLEAWCRCWRHAPYEAVRPPLQTLRGQPKANARREGKAHPNAALSTKYKRLRSNEAVGDIKIQCAYSSSFPNHPRKNGLRVPHNDCCRRLGLDTKATVHYHTHDATSAYTDFFAPSSTIESDSAVHWRRRHLLPQDRLSDWGWSRIFLFAGKDVKFDPSFELRQVWSFTVEADEDLANDENFAVEEQRAQYGTLKASGSEVEDPKDLSALLKCWIRPRSNRLRVLHFLNFTGSDTQGWYKEHLVEKEGECGLKVHLFGKVTHMSKVEDRWHETNVEDAEKTEAFGLLSFPGEREYAGFLVSDEHRRLVRGADKNGEEVRKEGVGIVEEGMILTKEMRLPPKDQVINRYGWQYGNPYEPFGEDFFG